tara:strand:- start:2745 stop:2864 length:120 start_codon:yes stop_codon:yes gene_type:complete
MDKDSYYKLEVTDRKKAEEVLDICFGKDSSKRKDLLIMD